MWYSSRVCARNMPHAYPQDQMMNSDLHLRRELSRSSPRFGIKSAVAIFSGTTKRFPEITQKS